MALSATSRPTSAPFTFRSALMAIAAVVGAAGLARRVERARIWRREFSRVRDELSTYSERELAADLLINRSAIGELATRAADERLAAFLGSPTERRDDGRWWAHEPAAG